MDLIINKAAIIFLAWGIVIESPTIFVVVFHLTFIDVAVTVEDAVFVGLYLLFRHLLKLILILGFPLFFHRLLLLVVLLMLLLVGLNRGWCLRKCFLPPPFWNIRGWRGWNSSSPISLRIWEIWSSRKASPFYEWAKEKFGLNHYLIKEKIGHGAFGEIYLAINQEDHSEVALKIENAMSKRSQLLY